LASAAPAAVAAAGGTTAVVAEVSFLSSSSSGWMLRIDEYSELSAGLLVGVAADRSTHCPSSVQ
jgi:hypothetical protein